MSLFMILNEENEQDRIVLKKLFRIKGNEISMMLKRGYSTDEILTVTYGSNLNNASNFFIPHRGDVITKLFLYEELTPLEYITMKDRNINIMEEKFNKFLEYRRTYKLFRSREEFSFVWKDSVTNSFTATMYLYSGEGTSVTTAAYGKLIKPIIIGNNSGTNLVIYTNNTLGQTSHDSVAIQIKHFITISEKQLGTDNEEYNSERTRGIVFEDFLDSNLAIEAPKHCFAPLYYEYISPERSAEWAKQERLQLGKMPAMLRSDPISKSNNAESHGVFKMDVTSSTYDVNTFYRVVINPKRPKKDK